jgi:uncharacterized small protein (TIGR04563 family)
VNDRGNSKQSFYVPSEMLAEMKAEAERLDRSYSWLIQQAWKIARGDIRRMPSQEVIG